MVSIANHISFGQEDVYLTGVYKSEYQSLRIHHGWSLGVYLINKQDSQTVVEQ
jgi:hypothetical protein